MRTSAGGQYTLEQSLKRHAALLEPKSDAEWQTGLIRTTQEPVTFPTTDAWFGVSSGPFQNFQAARLRAVEQGLPVVRVANTVTSGIINPLGQVVASMPLGHSGILDVALPAPLEHLTPWSRYSNWTLLVILLPGLAFIPPP